MGIRERGSNTQKMLEAIERENKFEDTERENKFEAIETEERRNKWLNFIIHKLKRVLTSFSTDASKHIIRIPKHEWNSAIKDTQHFLMIS